MGYTIAVERLCDVQAELEPIYREHYAEMAARLASMRGVEISPYNPRWDEYLKADAAGYLVTFVIRCDGLACGYGNIYLTNDMHNHDKIAVEDTIYVRKPHRNGIGRKAVQFGLEEMKRRGAKRLTVTAVTDARVAKLWKRMGFTEDAIQMTYTF